MAGGGFKKFLAIHAVVCTCFAIIACRNQQPIQISDFERQTRQIYEIGLRDGQINDLSYEDWLSSIKGVDGHSPIITIGSNGNWFIDENDTGISAYGIEGKQGQAGKDGYSILTGHGEPSCENGNNGDSYIDLDTWDYYIKKEDVWVAEGNIRGDSGKDGISITSSYIDENGDLIVILSSGELINAGHIKDANQYTVEFYCDDLLVETQYVNHGDKIILPELEDFVVKHWYIDKEFEYEWFWYGCVVTEDLILYGDYEAIQKEISFDDKLFQFDEFGYGEILQDGKAICASKATTINDCFISLNERGILFNKDDIGNINNLIVNVDFDDGAILFFGDYPLSTENSIALHPGLNSIDLFGHGYFTLQNSGTTTLNIYSLHMMLSKKTVFSNDELPKIFIETKNQQQILSNTDYVECAISFKDDITSFDSKNAQIRLRGTSTLTKPKKPYRLKFDKKISFFGLTAAKNWVLLADYLDASYMHNYSSLLFSKTFRDSSDFSCTPNHVSVYLNGKYSGLYLLTEQCDEKSGRLNIEEDSGYFLSLFDENNNFDFYSCPFQIERDITIISESGEIEDLTYFKIGDMPYAIKYPEIKDFYVNPKDSTSFDETKYSIFLSTLKDYVFRIDNLFRNCLSIPYDDLINQLNDLVDLDSFCSYSLVDKFFYERDHYNKSFKLYKTKNSGKLRFGPTWDYDSTAWGLPYLGEPVDNPMLYFFNENTLTTIGDTWNAYFSIKSGSNQFFSDYYSIYFDESTIDNYLNNIKCEIKKISHEMCVDISLWHSNNYSMLFDNLQYTLGFIETQIMSFKSTYSNN